MGNNTDLKGAVIASEADDIRKNRLDTGTISFSDIENKADFNVTHVSVSGGTGGPGMPTAYQNSDSASSTTKSAVEQGQLIIRNQDEQQQNIADLSRDTKSANNPLKQIFDKQKELDKIETVELIKDIAQQAKSITQKYDRIQAQKDIENNKELLSKAEALKQYNDLSDEDKAKISFEKFYTDNQDYWYYAAVDTQLEANKQKGNNIGTMGSDVSKGIDTATAIITGIITGDMTGGLAGASAPWLAEQIKIQAGDNETARLVAHAILGAVVAELQGNSALSGGAGAVVGEVAADIIRKQLYGKDVKDLTEEEKQTISALSQLASGLAVAAGGGNFGDASAAISSSKNAVENNYGDYVGYAFYNASKTKCGDDPECINKTTMEIMQGQKEFMDKYGKPIIIAEAAALTLPALISVLPESAIIGGTISGGGNAVGQYLTTGKVNSNDVIIWTGVGMFTGGYGTGLWGTTGWGIAGGATSSYLKDENPIIGGLIGGSSSFVGYGAGKLVENPLQSWFNPVANKYIHETNRGFLGITGHYTESSIPAWGGSLTNSGTSELFNKIVNDRLKENNNEKK